MNTPTRARTTKALRTMRAERANEHEQAADRKFSRPKPLTVSANNTQGTGGGAGTGSGNGSSSGSGSTNTGGGAGTGPKAVELAYSTDRAKGPVNVGATGIRYSSAAGTYGAESEAEREKKERHWQRLRKLAANGRLKAGQPY